MEVSKTCKAHNNPLVKEIKNFSGKVVGGYCQKCLNDSVVSPEDIEKHKDEMRAEREQKVLNFKLHNAIISPRFKEKTLDNYETTTKEQRRALSDSRWFIKHFEFATGMIFIGSTGTGKNHLACGIIQEIVRTDKTAILTTTMKMIRAIKDSWTDRDIKEGDVIALYTQPDLLVIDEIGVQFGSDTEKLYISEIINDRYEAMKPTILLGNVSKKELIKEMGDRAIDRFRENGKMVIFDWQSHRAKK